MYNQSRTKIPAFDVVQRLRGPFVCTGHAESGARHVDYEKGANIMGTIKAVCTSHFKGAQKTQRPQVWLRPDKGIEDVFCKVSEGDKTSIV